LHHALDGGIADGSPRAVLSRERRIAYQPVVAATSGAVRAGEVRSRWFR
jgi:EAL domain-containing protein (putative c-di-GMP-specific phosphodiesterase class I)